MGIAVLIQLVFPFVEERRRDVLDGFDTVVYFSGFRFAPIQLRLELIVFFLERPATRPEDGAESIERGLKLLLGFLLRVARLLDTAHQNVALVMAELLHRVEEGLLTSRSKNEREQQRASPEISIVQKF